VLAHYKKELPAGEVIIHAVYGTPLPVLVMRRPTPLATVAIAEDKSFSYTIGNVRYDTDKKATRAEDYINFE
jgi:hypothetical protein